LATLLAHTVKFVLAAFEPCLNFIIGLGSASTGHWPIMKFTDHNRSSCSSVAWIKGSRTLQPARAAVMSASLQADHKRPAIITGLACYSSLSAWGARDGPLADESAVRQ